MRFFLSIALLVSSFQLQLARIKTSIPTRQAVLDHDRQP